MGTREHGSCDSAMDDTHSEPKAHFLIRLLRIAVAAVRELVLTLVPALLLVLFMNVFVAEAALVEEGPSMQPNLYRGDRVMTEKVSYRFTAPQRGDVVIVRRPAPEQSLIKRVVALPGEVVEVREGHVWIDGDPIEEPWVTYFGGPDYGPARVPAAHVFVLGDNRPNSRDSREIGPVPLSSVHAHAIFVYWPLAHWGAVP
jgi:signal peptidase I